MRKTLMVLLLAFPFLFSCATAVKQECPVCQPKIVEKPVIVRCEIPEVPPANLEKITEQDPYDERLRKLIKNYGLLKEQNYLLRKATEVCR